MSAEYNPLPPQQWVKEAPNGDIHLCDTVDGQPLTGYGFDQESGRPPMRFEQDMYGYQDGRLFWANADEESGENVEVAVLLTDPSRPDGLGQPGAFEQIAQQYDIIGHTGVRGVMFAAQQHGIGEGKPGLYLGDNTSHEDYAGQLDETLSTLGVPNFSFTPSINSGLMVPIVRSLQRGRDMVYDLAANQKDLKRAGLDVYMADMAHTNELGHAMLAEAGEGLRKYIDNDIESGGYPKPFPERILLIAPGEYGNLQEHLEAAMGVSPEDGVVETGSTAPESMRKGTKMYWYVQTKSLGYIPNEELR